MKKVAIMILVAVIMGISGCGLSNEQKIEAYKRWHLARARVICEVGRQHLKVGDLDRAKVSAMEALALEKDSVPARVLLGKVLLEMGNYVAAAEELRKVEVDAPQSAEIPFLRGVALERRGEYAEALKAYQKARALDPGNDAYVTASAEVLVAWGKAKLALELLETRLERTDGDLMMLALAGELAMLVDEPAKAAGYYQRCLDTNAKHLAAREGLAKASFFAGKHAESLEALKVLADHRAYRDKTSWVYVMTGNCYMALNRPYDARAAYESASRINPGDAQVWVSLAKAAMVLGDTSRAMLAARRALSLKEGCSEARIVLAYSMLANGEPGGAAKILAEEARKNPNNAIVLCVLGRCYASMGREDQAAGCYVQALRSDPEHRLARRLLAKTGLARDGLR